MEELKSRAQWKVCRSMLMKCQVLYKAKNCLRTFSGMNVVNEVNNESAIRNTSSK
jgi:hypothetical protein